MMHDEHTMTLERVQRMMITGNTRFMLKRGWLPKFLIRKSYINLMEYIDKMFGEGEDKDFRNDTIRTAMWNKIHNILKIMHTLLAIDKSELAEERFKHYWGRDFVFPEDLKLIESEIKRLTDRFHLMFYKKERKEADETVTFENVIQGVEMVLDKPHIPRTISLYQFSGYYDQAQKAMSDRKMNRHGKT